MLELVDFAISRRKRYIVLQHKYITLYRTCYLFLIFLGKVAPLYITRSDILASSKEMPRVTPMQVLYLFCLLY